jgi:Fe-S-cluster containining protein
MSRTRRKRVLTLAERYPPSPPCSCAVCAGYCARPGWWTVVEATRAIEAGYGERMMLEIAPELTFGVLSPAFKGCEAMFALNEFASRGCTFLADRRCELYGTPYQPLECRYCHHDRPGMGQKCHADIEEDWHTPAGQALVARWSDLVGLGARLPAWLGLRANLPVRMKGDRLAEMRG